MTTKKRWHPQRRSAPPDGGLDAVLAAAQDELDAYIAERLDPSAALLTIMAADDDPAAAATAARTGAEDIPRQAAQRRGARPP